MHLFWKNSIDEKQVRELRIKFTFENELTTKPNIMEEKDKIFFTIKSLFIYLI